MHYLMSILLFFCSYSFIYPPEVQCATEITREEAPHLLPCKKAPLRLPFPEQHHGWPGPAPDLRSARPPTAGVRTDSHSGRPGPAPDFRPLSVSDSGRPPSPSPSLLQASPECNLFLYGRPITESQPNPHITSLYVKIDLLYF